MQCAPPVFLGHGEAAYKVATAIHGVVHSRDPLLVIGARGTGKRTVAEILHHFGGGECPTVEDVEIAGGQASSIADFAYLCPVEELTLEQQDQLVERVRLARLILGTRLDPATPEAAAQLSPVLLNWCRARIYLPTLAERVDDLESIALALIPALPASRPIAGISKDALDCMRGHDWPGNVTELEQVLASALERGTGPQIELSDLPPDMRLRDVDDLPASSPNDYFSLRQTERRAVFRAMHVARGNKRLAARLLGIGKTTLYRKLRSYGEF